MTQVLSPPTKRDLQVTWRPTRPDFTVTCLYGRGTSTSRGYHESYFEVVGRQRLEADDFKALDRLGLIGIGQAYHVIKEEAFTDDVPAVTIDRRTGDVLVDVPPINDYSGEPIITLHPYQYWRYTVRRICDSGD